MLLRIYVLNYGTHNIFLNSGFSDIYILYHSDYFLLKTTVICFHKQYTNSR